MGKTFRVYPVRYIKFLPDRRYFLHLFECELKQITKSFNNHDNTKKTKNKYLIRLHHVFVIVCFHYHFYTTVPGFDTGSANYPQFLPLAATVLGLDCSLKPQQPQTHIKNKGHKSYLILLKV